MTEFDHISVIENSLIAHAPCHVTYHQGQKWFAFLKSMTPIYLVTLSLSGHYDED